MLKLRFYILALCVFFPPIAYILTLQIAESHFAQDYQKDIETVFLGDTRLLLNGTTDIRDVIQTQIGTYLANDLLVKLGADVQITVVTRQNTLLFPLVTAFVENRGFQQNAMGVASENYKFMNEGIMVKVNTKVPHSALLSQGILTLYILLDLTLLIFYYRKTEKAQIRQQQEKNQELERLSFQEQGYRSRLKNLALERENQTLELDAIRKNLETEKKLAATNEDELVNDIVALEKKLEDQTSAQKMQDSEIAHLKEMIQGLETEQQKLFDIKKGKASGVHKRFETLYRNISFHDRAFEGIKALSEDMKIKCEEIIHQLNSDSGQVPIKRKVFGPKGRATVFEVVFAYKGRLYYRNLMNRRVEVLIVGTKNTQGKDLEFLNRL